MIPSTLCHVLAQCIALNFVPGFLPKERVVGNGPHYSTSSSVSGLGGMGPEDDTAERPWVISQTNGCNSQVEEQSCQVL